MNAWRPAQPTDLKAINRLLETFGREASKDDLNASVDLQVWMTDSGSAMFAIYFARDLGRWTAHFTSISVAPEARGQGLARQAVGLAEHLARRFAAQVGERMRVFGYTNPERKATIHILEDAGWQRLSDGEGTSLWALDIKP